MFDYHDHMTHTEAGSPDPGYEVYPLKAMAEIDNTCRLAIHFVPTRQGTGTVRYRAREGTGRSLRSKRLPPADRRLLRSSHLSVAVLQSQQARPAHT